VRRVAMILLAGTGLWASPALAADTLKFGPAPAWVHAQRVPPAKPSDAPVLLLLQDQQIALTPAKVSAYSEVVFKIQKSDGLSAGNLSLVWQPATDTVTVNKLQIRRGGKIIDVLAGGQTFTVLRRETNLEAAVLDGTLTGNIQPEGLQEGDIVDFATTVERSDPVLKGHVESDFAAWNGLPVEAAHVTLSWPSDLHLNVRETANLPTARRSSANGMNILELSAADVQPVVPPRGAPLRFKIGRLGEATDFASWSDLARLFIPLFREASVIPASGSLHDEVEKIRTSTSDPKRRAEQALALVQDRVRYVALLMGQGGYVPAAAETTWSRRFGDCKGKTALLLGILHSLGIEAEPVLAQPELGDMIADRLPMVGLFDHVLVRAHIGGKDYWLDGTRSGDTQLDSIKVPDFGWGLPLIENAQLVRIQPPPLDTPDTETALQVDASSGVYAPAPATADQTLRGDLAVEYQSRLSALTQSQQQDFYRTYWSSLFDFISFKSGSFSFDKDKRELHLTMTGEAKLEWVGGYFHVPQSAVGFHPNFDRPAGPSQDAPLVVDYPSYTKTVIHLRMPASFVEGRKFGSADVHETLAGVEYDRSSTINGTMVTVETSARSVVPEISYSEAIGAETRLTALADQDVALPMPSGYKTTAADLDALKTDTGAGANDLVTRGNILLAAHRLDDAIANFTKAVAIDPKNVMGFADRGIAYFYKKDFAAARKDLDAAQAIDPDNAVLLRARAMLAAQNGDTLGAIQDYSKSLVSEPGNTFALFQRARLYSANEQDDLALKDVSQILANDPKNLGALVERADIYLAKYDYQSAAKDLAAARAINPDDTAVLDTQARLAGAQGNADAELATYSRMVAVATNKAPALARRAEAYRQAKRFSEALADSDAALKLGDTDPTLRLTRANLFMEEDKREAVAAEADAMMRENPRSTLALVAAGKSYAAIGERDKAMDALTRALAIKAEPYIYINRADVRPRSDFAGRIADLDEALKLEPDNKITLSEKVRVLSQQGKYDAALAVLDTMPALDDNDRNLRATVLAKAGRTAEAEALLKSMRASATTAHQLNSLCWTKATSGIMLESALQDCRDALKLQPNDGAYLDSLGLVLLKLGRLDEALDAYNKALANSSGSASLMGRAYVYLRKGDRRHADADAAAARKVYARIDETFADYGLKWDVAAQGGQTTASAHQ
jgi:tetratricopeptide (TPR) repeat protein